MCSPKKLSLVIVGAFLVAMIGPWQAAGQDTKSGVVNSRDKILDTTSSKQSQPQTQTQTQKVPPDTGTLPCNSQTNPKCQPASKTKPGE